VLPDMVLSRAEEAAREFATLKQQAHAATKLRTRAEALAAIRDSYNGTLNGTPNGSPRTMAVLSNKPVIPSRAIVEALGLGQFFSQIYGGNSFATKKPDPEGARKLLEEYGVQPQHAAIIGDSHVDVSTGRNAGMVTIGVTYGFAPHTLQDEPPDVVVDYPHELGAVFAAP